MNPLLPLLLAVAFAPASTDAASAVTAEKALHAVIYKAYDTCRKERLASATCAIRADRAGRNFTLAHPPERK